MPSGKGYLTASVLDLMLPSWLREGDVHEYIRQTPRGPSHQSPIHTDMWGYMSHTSVWSNRHVGVHVPRSVWSNKGAALSRSHSSQAVPIVMLISCGQPSCRSGKERSRGPVRPCLR